MNNKNQNSKGSGVVTLAVLAGILLFNLFSSRAGQEEVPVFALSLIVVAFITVLVITVSMAKANRASGKKQPAVPRDRPAAPKPARAPARQHRDAEEEVVSCGHKSGKEKYLEQVEGFYKNGLIDRAEYKKLREKYEKLEIPEDYH